jgi:putative ABC transport system ATP-binding protein
MYVERSGIRAADVTVRYGDIVAVSGVSVEVPPGSFLAVSGPSGAGKSSLLWAIAGALRPASGTVLIDGEQVGDRFSASARGVVLIPQGNGLARMLTARENISVPLLASRPRRKKPRYDDEYDDADQDRRDAEELAEEVAERVDRALTDVGLEESGNHLVEELSGGEQQRVAVARGLALRGSVVLADESTSELDSTNRERVVDLLRAEARRGASVVIATHDLDVAAEADGHAILDEGHLTWNRSLF